MAYSNQFANQYFYSVDWASPKKEDKELSAKEHLQRVEEYIAKFNVEHDDDAVYLYKAVNLDGTNKYQSDNKITYELGKVYTEKCDRDINNSCSKGLHAATYDKAIEFGKDRVLTITSNANTYDSTIMLSPGGLTWTANSSIINPSIIYKKPNFRLFKVKIFKKYIVVPENTDGKIRCSQMEILEEVKLTAKIKYKIQDIKEVENGYEFTFNVYNEFNNNNINIKFIYTRVELTEDEIKERINSRIVIMQKMYDQFQKSNGEL
jgi:hypothetical protein